MQLEPAVVANRSSTDESGWVVPQWNTPFFSVPFFLFVSLIIATCPRLCTTAQMKEQAKIERFNRFFSRFFFSFSFLWIYDIYTMSLVSTIHVKRKKYFPSNKMKHTKVLFALLRRWDTGKNFAFYFCVNRNTTGRQYENCVSPMDAITLSDDDIRFIRIHFRQWLR